MVNVGGNVLFVEGYMELHTGRYIFHVGKWVEGAPYCLNRRTLIKLYGSLDSR